MDKPIVNRVANSPLITLDLEEFYPRGERRLLDISPWLLEGLIIREKDFRAQLKEHDWAQYKDQYVALHCSTDAIIPGWAYMLVATYLTPFARLTHVGDLSSLENAIGAQVVLNLETTDFTDAPVIIKRCPESQ